MAKAKAQRVHIGDDVVSDCMVFVDGSELLVTSGDEREIVRADLVTTAVDLKPLEGGLLVKRPLAEPALVVFNERAAALGETVTPNDQHGIVDKERRASEFLFQDHTVVSLLQEVYDQGERTAGFTKGSHWTTMFRSPKKFLALVVIVPIVLMMTSVLFMIALLVGPLPVAIELVRDRLEPRPVAIIAGIAAFALILTLIDRIIPLVTGTALALTKVLRPRVGALEMVWSGSNATVNHSPHIALTSFDANTVEQASYTNSKKYLKQQSADLLAPKRTYGRRQSALTWIFIVGLAVLWVPIVGGSSADPKNALVFPDVVGAALAYLLIAMFAMLGFLIAGTATMLNHIEASSWEPPMPPAIGPFDLSSSDDKQTHAKAKQAFAARIRPSSAYSRGANPRDKKAKAIVVRVAIATFCVAVLPTLYALIW